MAAGLGRLATDFLDDISRSGTLNHLTLHDAQGRLVHDAFVRPTPPAAVAHVLRTGISAPTSTSSASEMVFIRPLPNEPACQTCHGLVGPVLGAIEIRLNTGEEQAELSALRRNSAFYGVSTIALVLALLALGLYYAVIRPVREIGAVADLVGAGQLDTNVDIQSADEMGRLGRRINDMVLGLRQKIELSKFVSRDTLHEVEASAGTVARHGEKRRIAVLFSDIRGFTLFTESHEPEEVVGMLNRCLQVQAEVALRHGGDIDKFVGDEIMVRFDGPDMALRATRAAVEMAEVVTQLNLRGTDPTQGTAVGVGVSVGDAVLGAMGAERRMDFTAIGDAVNLGARLCSAAGRGEVLISEAVRIDIGDAQGLVFTPLDPIMVKGKQAPVTIYRAERAPGK
jgi:adenylate cyclase